MRQARLEHGIEEITNPTPLWIRDFFCCLDSEPALQHPLPSSSEGLRRYAVAVALNERHPFQLVQVFGYVGFKFLTWNIEVGLERTHDAVKSNSRLARIYR